MVAVMRETVQPGSKVIIEEVTGAGQTYGPYAVTVQPPFECLQSAEPIGPLDEGTYVIRVRYEDRPGTLDLASGTLTIKGA
jgi:hypothetical protein